MKIGDLVVTKGTRKPVMEILKLMRYGSFAITNSNAPGMNRISRIERLRNRINAEKQANEYTYALCSDTETVTSSQKEFKLNELEYAPIEQITP